MTIEEKENYNLYDIFKFLLNQLVNTREVAEDAKQYATDMSEKSQIDLEKKTVLAEMMERKTGEENNRLGDFEEEIIKKIKNQDREINVNEARKNEFTKIYQLNDLKKLVLFLKYDFKRLRVAEGGVEVFEQDGYDAFDFINNTLEKEHQEEFYSEYILSKQVFELMKTWENCDELKKERVYGDLRQYIEKTIVSLFKTIFRGKHEEKIIAELIEFDISMFKSEIGISNDLNLNDFRKKKRGDMNNYLDNIQQETRKKEEEERLAEEEQRLAEEEAARVAAEEEQKLAEEENKIKEYKQVQQITDINNEINAVNKDLKELTKDNANKIRNQINIKKKNDKIKDLKSRKNTVHRKIQNLPEKEAINKYLKNQGIMKGGGELTVTNISAIINYIGKRVHYMRSDAFNKEKIKELQNMIENYEDAIRKLDHFIAHLNETINMRYFHF